MSASTKTPASCSSSRDGELVGGGLAFRSSPRQATLRVLGLVAAARGQGLGRALLGAIEEAAGALDLESITLGAEEAADFYVHCGWTPLLLLQWVHDAAAFEEESAAVVAGPAAGRPHQRRSYNTVPQLFVELASAHRKAIRDAADLAPGAHVGFAMTKRLSAPAAT